MTSAAPSSPADAARERRLFWWLMLAALVVLGAGIGLRDPWPSDEPRFTLVAKHMVESGDWLFPHRGTELYSDKPPMLMWLEAAAYQVFGNWRIAFLLPSLLAGMLTLVLTWDLGRRLWNPRVGLFAAAAVLVTFQFVYQVKRAQIDPLVMMWITLANWGLLLHLLKGPNWRAYWLGCFAAGLGVITKGVGVLALLMLLPWLFARSRGWAGVNRTPGSAWQWAGGALAFLAAIALWLVPMLLVAHARGSAEYDAYVNDILLRQTAKRYGGSVGGHAQPFWYYLPVLVLHFFPMSLAYLGAWRGWWQGLRQRDARLLLLLGWSVLVVFFFSLAGGKREVYLMPVLPMLALALGPSLQASVGARWMRVTAWLAAMAAGGFLLVGGIWAMQGHWSRMEQQIVERGLADGGRGLWWMGISMGAVFLLSALAFRPRRGVHALLAGMAGFWIIWGVWASALFNDSNSAVGVMRKAGQIAGPQAQIGLVAWKEQNLLMADRPVTTFGFKREWEAQYAAAVRWQAEAPDQRWIFALRDAVESCVIEDRAQVVGYANRRLWWIFRADAVRPDCVPRIDPQAERWDSSYGSDDED
ncbi:glycosyltransferase family 39 protein [Comamonadaceae bacterium G21597-S1]|nr:glycosyltransferase family 39 protein [Comamonadaceae bacterium G21597-S1]